MCTIPPINGTRGIRKTCSHRAWEVVSILELTQEERDEEAPEHQAHGQQSCVGVGRCFMGSGLVDGGLHVRVVEGVVDGVVQMGVVQDQRVGFEDLPRPEEEETMNDSSKACICVEHNKSKSVLSWPLGDRCDRLRLWNG